MARLSDRLEPAFSWWFGWAADERSSFVLSVTSAILALDAASTRTPDTAEAKGRYRFGGTLLLIAAAMFAAWLARNITDVPGILVAYGRYAASRVGQADIIYMNASQERFGGTGKLDLIEEAGASVDVDHKTSVKRTANGDDLFLGIKVRVNHCFTLTESGRNLVGSL